MSLAILDYRKLAEVDGIQLMNFTDHQLDSSLAFIVEKFVEKGILFQERWVLIWGGCGLGLTLHL